MSQHDSRVDDLLALFVKDKLPIGVDKYIVSFAGMPANVNRELTFQCEAVDLPGMSLSDEEHTITSSPVRKVPQGKTYANEITLSLRLSTKGGDLYERRMFEDWMNSIYNYDTQQFAFYRTYIDDMSIVVQDSDDTIVYKCNFEEVYPIEISPISLSPKGDYLRQDVKLAYYRWRNVLWPRRNAPNTAPAAVGGKVVESETIMIPTATQAEIDRLRNQRNYLINRNRQDDRMLEHPDAPDAVKEGIRGRQAKRKEEIASLDAQLKLAEGGRAV